MIDRVRAQGEKHNLNGFHLVCCWNAVIFLVILLDFGVVGGFCSCSFKVIDFLL